MMKRIALSALALLSLTACADLNRADRAAAQGDYPSAAAQWQVLSDYGIAPAQVKLGMAYLKGQGVARNVPAGLALLDRAAAANDPKVSFEIGRLYATGVPGVLKPDYKKSWTFLNRALAGGQGRALVVMADLTEKGQGVPRNPKKAAQMMQTASEAGVGSATHRLARAALKAGNIAAAQPLLEKAFAQGAENAGVTLAGLYLKQGNVDRARALYAQATAAGATPDPVLAEKLGK